MTMAGDNSIPITVFTGFLGAGKTSIILSLLPKLPPDYKAVLLKNEYGDIEGTLKPRSEITFLMPQQWTVSLQTNQTYLGLARS